MAGISRRAALAGLGAAALLPRAALGATACCDIRYLEGLGQAGALHPSVAFIPPSLIHPSYQLAIYINAGARSEASQKMWVLRRNGANWRLGLWDADYWAGKAPNAPPAYSWPVSTGRKYSDSPSGPTPLGIFNVDDRNHRHRKGWGSPGMFHSIYFDLHYRGGRASGVAMHGTTRSKYRLLGRIDSHGCVRMTQANAEQMWQVFHPGDARGAASPLWGEVPRYFRSEPRADGRPRYGYVRDGSLLQDESARVLTKEGYRAVIVVFRDDL